MYELIETKTHAEAGACIRTYGIRCGNQTIEDISLNKGDISMLVAECNRHHLEPIHLADIVEDFLSR